MFQSMALLQYVSTLANLIPSDPLDAAVADAISHSCNDLYNTMGPWWHTPADQKEAVSNHYFIVPFWSQFSLLA